MNIPGVIRIKTTVGNRRYRVLTLDVHSVMRCVCVCVCVCVTVAIQQDRMCECA